jgi:hypothetical protein
MASMSLTASWKCGTVSTVAQVRSRAPRVLMGHEPAFIRKVYSILFVQIVSLVHSQDYLRRRTYVDNELIKSSSVPVS